MILFFDTETTGMIKDFKKPTDGSDNIPNIVQLGYSLYDLQGRVIIEAANLIIPKGWIIEPQAQEIHGKTLEMCQAEGINIEDSLKVFLRLHYSCSVAVAHNYNFDSKVVRAEMIRCNLDKYDFKAKTKLCTMMSTTKLCRIPQKNGKGLKWPKLKELHEFLFGFEPEDQHDALGDVRATAKCFFELLKRGEITITQ